MSSEDTSRGPLPGWRGRAHEIIFEADTVAGKVFDIGLLIAISASVLVVMLESVDGVSRAYGPMLRACEWGFTVLFTVEYVLRLLVVRRPWRYATSFYGWVDLLSILPTYLSVVFPATRFLLVIRVLRMLRAFRVLMLSSFVSESARLVHALRASWVKITVFLYAVLTGVLVIGAAMYAIEGPTNAGFDSIPRSVYWAVVTLTTVGYGDIAPRTAIGQFLAAALMILGYGVIAVPTGIVSVELARYAEHTEISTQHCPTCSFEGHDRDAVYCKRCGEKL